MYKVVTDLLPSPSVSLELWLCAVNNQIMLFVVFVPWLVLNWGNIEPFKRGFFCDDESLKHPYKESSISNTGLVVLGMCLPTLTVSIQSKMF